MVRSCLSPIANADRAQSFWCYVRLCHTTGYHAMSLTLLLLLVTGLDQEAGQKFTLSHLGRPTSVKTTVEAYCDPARATTLTFTETGQGVIIAGPRTLHQSSLTTDDLRHRELLETLGSLRSYRVTCQGNDAIFVFRGFPDSLNRTPIVVVETHDQQVVRYHSQSPLIEDRTSKD